MAAAQPRVFASIVGQGFFDLLAPGLYAWALTVAWPAAQRLAPWESRLLAGAALLALVAGAILSRLWPFAARMAGLWLFLACSLGVWVLLARSLAPTHLDPVHGLLGAAGWAVFAVVWGGDRPAPESHAARSLPGSEPRRRTALIMAIAAAAAAIPVAFAWWVESAERALLAHTVSLAASLTLLATAADLAAPPPRETGPLPPPERPKRRLLGAAWPLAALAGLVLAGILFALVR